MPMSTALQHHIQSIQVATYRFPDDGVIPNNPTLPFLVYPGVLRFAGSDPAAVAEGVFAANGWGDSWRNGIFPYPHYHSTAHEALILCRGGARVRFGGAQGVVLTVQAGDAVVIPAGVGHENLGASADLLVVGAYPPGQAVDLHKGKEDERPTVLENIAQVPLPATDPLYGATGPLLTLWQQ
jgi:uncharacterized protein YjlB